VSILSVTTPETLAMSVISGDEKSLTAAAGVGKKIAQRIILELKDKLAKESQAFTSVPGGGGEMVFSSKTGEAAAALSVLGYSSSETAAAMKGVDVQNLPLEEIIRACLKKMAK
jgi:Holliday junction DNA helicase RuvA